MNVREHVNRQAVTDCVIDLLNHAIVCDPKAVHELLQRRVPCTEQMANHPTIQVLCEDDGSNPRVGMLGIINGFLERLTGERIAVSYLGDDQSRAECLQGFDRYDAPTIPEVEG